MVSQLGIHGMGATFPPMSIRQVHMAMDEFGVLKHGSHSESIHAVEWDEHEHEDEYAHAAGHECEQTLP